jgi:hypothetical protein
MQAKTTNATIAALIVISDLGDTTRRPDTTKNKKRNIGGNICAGVDSNVALLPSCSAVQIVANTLKRKITKINTYLLEMNLSRVLYKTYIDNNTKHIIFQTETNPFRAGTLAPNIVKIFRDTK